MIEVIAHNASRKAGGLPIAGSSVRKTRHFRSSLVNIMKAPSSPSNIVSLLLLSIVFAIAGNAEALAQRESFDASLGNTLEVIIAKLASEPTAVIPRRGTDSTGIAREIRATDISTHFDSIQFRLDSTVYSDVLSEQTIARIAQALRSPKLKAKSFLIEGHTCDLGPESYNLKLSARRAEVVKRSLVRFGVDPGRLRALGLGKSEPLKAANVPKTPQELETARAKNRRVAVRLLLSH